MIKFIMKKALCRIIGHRTIEAGSCPFTGKSYLGCIRCEKVIEK